MNYLHYFRTKIKFKSHEKVCKNHDVYDVVMLNEKKSIKVLSISKIYLGIIYYLCRSWIFDQKKY